MPRNRTRSHDLHRLTNGIAPAISTIDVDDLLLRLGSIAVASDLAGCTCRSLDDTDMNATLLDTLDNPRMRYIVSHTIVNSTLQFAKVVNIYEYVR
jgi:hypothetical protein